MVSPSAHRSQCTSAGCYGKGRAPGRAQSRIDRTQ